MRKFIETDIAIDLILSKIKKQGKEVIKLEDSFNRILASDIFTKIPIPNFRKSPFDGYCLKNEYSKGASYDNPKELKVSGTIKAGDDIKYLKLGTYKIMTGAEIPEFCDLVIKKEDTNCGDNNVLIYKEGIPDENIIKIGEDVGAGVKIVNKGTKIKPGIVAMLATIGIYQLEVFKLPKVGLITTGDEVIDLKIDLSPGKIYNSNKYALLGFINELGIKANDYGVANDNIEVLKGKIKLALEENDVIITTGGVSVGDYDYIQDVYNLLNIEKIFWSVKMKPGTPVMAGRLGDKIIISLPGSPAASLITYEVIAKPVIKFIMGYNEYLAKRYIGIMKDDFKKLSNITRFLRVYITIGNEGYEIHLSGKQNAGVLQSMLSCTALAKVLNPNEAIKIGDKLEFSFVNEAEN